MLATLDQNNHGQAVLIAGVPESMRGFGHVKLANVAMAQAREAELLHRLDPARQGIAIADQLVQKLKEKGHGDIRIEGMPQCDWVLVDAGDVVVHIFRPEVREFYNIEKMWSA